MIVTAIWITTLVGFFGYVFLFVGPEISRKNREEAAEIRKKIEWIKPYAERGDDEAQYLLATLYARDAWKITDYKEAYAWAEKSALRGHKKAQLLLATLCEDSISERGLPGVRCNSSEMIKWYRMAAEQGESVAQFRLAKGIYEYGHITGTPREEAYKWYLRSAMQGNPPASLFVGANMYYVGAGVEKDLVKAYMWVRLATKGIDNWTVAEKTLERIAKKMSPVEIEKAEDLARRWVPLKE